MSQKFNLKVRQDDIAIDIHLESVDYTNNLFDLQQVVSKFISTIEHWDRVQVVISKSETNNETN